MKPWKAGLGFLAAATAFYSVGALIAPPSWATDINVSVDSTCTANHQWRLTLNGHNAYTHPLTLQNQNSIELISDVLAPGADVHWPIISPDATFHYIWSTPDGIIVGTKEATLTRPDGCTPPTTLPGTTTTTTCAMAIPPRTDCEGATTSSPPPTTAPAPSTTAATPTSAAPVATTAAVPSQTSIAQTPTTTHINLPPTGSSTNAIIAVIVIALTGGALFILAARRRTT